MTTNILVGLNLKSFTNIFVISPYEETLINKFPHVRFTHWYLNLFLQIPRAKRVKRKPEK